MTALTLQVICKNPPVTLHEICKFQEHLLFMATSTLPQNLQEAAVIICSENISDNISICYITMFSVL